jgi:hypothetical protein
LKESEMVETSIEIIRNSVIELTPNVLVSPTEARNTIRSFRLTKAAGPEHITSGLAAKLSIGMLLLDVEKAFDCVA